MISLAVDEGSFRIYLKPEVPYGPGETCPNQMKVARRVQRSCHGPGP